MAKLIIIYLMLFYTNSLYSQNSDKITIGSIEKIYSKILKEERKIWIYNPGENNSDTTERYPVLYLLDAKEHFYSTVGMIKQMSGRWPKMIVVGITNTNRNRDLTPTLIGSDGSINANSGGGANFMSFVEKELIPHIDSTYLTAPYRLFSGHSLGGLTVINTLLRNTQLFNAYVAIDPSLWWNNWYLMQKRIFILRNSIMYPYL